MKFPFVSLAALAAFSTAPAVTSLRVVSTPGHADVVIGVESSVDIQDFTLDAPHRVEVDLKGVTLTDAVPPYDRIVRGGITDVRMSQLRANTVRVVIQLDSVHAYTIEHGAHEVRISIKSGDAKFAAWTPTLRNSDSSDNSQASTENTATTESTEDSSSAVDERAANVFTRAHSLALSPTSPQPLISVSYQDTDIRDVIAAFALYSGRTIIAGRDVAGTVTAEIHNQPWDVALRAILQGQGFAASEDPSSGIIMVDSYANILSKQASEPLVTQILPINYAKADSLVPIITKLLARDCTQGGTISGAGAGAGAGAQAGAGSSSCFTRGAVAANASTNTLILTETPSRIGDIISYVRRLDIRTPQVAIKAKIIFVDRTSIENLGLSYDLGTSQQFFTQLVQRIDPSTTKPIDTNGDGVPDALGGGTPFTSNQILVGGNTLSAIANANNRVTNPALSLIYSAALGKFSLTSFLDALREVQLADLQAEPSKVTLDNKEAQIQVGQSIPIRVLDASTVGAPGAGASSIPKATVTFKDVGIILRVTPHVTNDGHIMLNVHAENSNAQLASSDIGYIFNTQSADGPVLVADGETVVIGGLTVTQITQDKTGIPILADLPVIGRLFSTTNRSEEKRDLLILITPHIIDPGDQPRLKGN